MINHIFLDPAKPETLLKACPVYQPSPMKLFSFNEQKVWIKDETERMGLGAFKALGGVYAVARLIEERAGRMLSADEYLSDDIRAVAADTVFVCASAGNHGLAVAAGAHLFGAKARIHLSEQVPDGFADRLREKGAEVIRSGVSYEESVDAAITDAENTGAIHLADGSWPGYTEPPRLVMEGYTVIAEEMRRSFEQNKKWPSHVYLQAGVGGLAASMAYMIRYNWKVQPEIIVVEPDAAACLGESMKKGKLVRVSGAVSNMGCLDCKVPSMLAYEILKNTADHFVTVTDEEALIAIEVARDLGIGTTPSGVAGLAALMQKQEGFSNPLIIVSEGLVA